MLFKSHQVVEAAMGASTKQGHQRSNQVAHRHHQHHHEQAVTLPVGEMANPVSTESFRGYAEGPLRQPPIPKPKTPSQPRMQQCLAKNTKNQIAPATTNKHNKHSFSFHIPPYKGCMSPTNSNTTTLKPIGYSTDFAALTPTEAMKLLFHDPLPAADNPIAKLVLAIHLAAMEWGNQLEAVPTDEAKILEQVDKLKLLGKEITGANRELIHPELAKWMILKGFMGIGQAIPEL